ncbi:ion channel [Acidobacteriota bacterium]
MLLLVCTFIFILPIFPAAAHKVLFNSFLTVIFLTAVAVMDKHRRLFFALAIVNIIFEWIAHGMDLLILAGISNVLNILFFMFVVIRMIIQIARTRRVTARVIIESINGYLLLGLAFSLLVAIVMLFQPDAFSFPHSGIEVEAQVSYLSEYIYYGFVNFTTLGYGDIIPKVPFAKSIAILMSVTGQMYLAILIAMLVGKYVGSTSSNSVE